jgi:hypothetical protein
MEAIQAREFCFAKLPFGALRLLGAGSKTLRADRPDPSLRNIGSLTMTTNWPTPE